MTPQSPPRPRGVRVRVLHSGHIHDWNRVLERVVHRDFFDLPSYHQMAEETEKARARLFVYEEEGRTIALPLLFRHLEHVEALAPMTAGWQDATSVYGYSGPLCSESSPSPTLVQGFQKELCYFLRQSHVVSVFSRLNPLTDQTSLLNGMGGCGELGQTVSIDLKLSEQEQRAQYRLNHRRTISKLQRLGVEVLKDNSFVQLEAFAGIYGQTMRRVHAAGFYQYEPAYLRELMCRHPREGHLFLARFKGRMIAGLLVVGAGKIAHCHLSGTLDEYLKLSPMKLLFDAARQWACANGFETLHLGGGVGSRQDSLFHFKTGFSSLRHTFRCWRWIVCPDVYEHLCQRASLYLKTRGMAPASRSFFPFYRVQGQPMVNVEG